MWLLEWVWYVVTHGGEFVKDVTVLVSVATAILVLISDKARTIVRPLARWIIRKTPKLLPAPPLEPPDEPTIIMLPSGEKFGVYIPQGELPPDSERRFYKYFAKSLRRATDIIYNSGDGFSMNREQQGMYEYASSAQKADELDGAIIEALRNGAEYKRFQISSACSISWMSRLIWLKKNFERVEIYFNRSFDHTGSFCAIDPAQSDCVFEWQLVSMRPNLEGTFSRGYGFLIGSKQICREIHQLFADISVERNTNRLKTDSVDTSTRKKGG